MEKAIKILTPLYEAQRAVIIAYEDEGIKGAARRYARTACEVIKDVIDYASCRHSWQRPSSYNDVVIYVKEYLEENEILKPEDKEIVAEIGEIILLMLTEGETILSVNNEWGNNYD